jgi:fructuronate reductase
MVHLSHATLTSLPTHVRRPKVDPARLETGIVHVGVGAFHRAHQAVYTDDVVEAGDMRWGTVGASLRAADTRDALQPQDWLYSVTESDQSGERLRVVGSLQGLLVARESPSSLLQALCNPSVKVVSLTVTEKGYCHDPATGELNEDHPDIRHDLASPDSPKSAPGFIARAIALRHAQGLAPFTVLCCDNLPSNGHLTRRVISRLGGLHNAELGDYIAGKIAFPSTMVDRIVPAATEADRAKVAQALGMTDNWPVMTEGFTQWVIEDDFSSGRPDWAANFVSDVSPFETMKLRLLNGSHSCIAYLGYLAGYETVSDAMQDHDLARFLRRFMDEEATPTLVVPSGTDVAGYKTALINRFRNPSLRHRTWQIAMDGSQKLPQRFLGTIRDRLKSGGSTSCLALGVAAWMRYVTGIDENSKPIDVRDPLRDELRRRADAAGLDAARLAPALINIEAIFGRDLPAHEGFVAAVTSSLDQLIKLGARRALGQMKGAH